MRTWQDNRGIVHFEEQCSICEEISRGYFGNQNGPLYLPPGANLDEYPEGEWIVTTWDCGH